jgi:hypothetical protein
MHVLKDFRIDIWGKEVQRHNKQALKGRAYECQGHKAANPQGGLAVMVFHGASRVGIGDDLRKPTGANS